MPAIVKFENVKFSYSRVNNNDEKWALEDINLSVLQGEFLAVMGETGAGKTTFCRLINGIIPHLCGGQLLGNIHVDGENTKDVPASHLALKAGMVLDDPDSQLFTYSVRHEAAFGPENLLLPVQEIEERVNFALKAVGLGGFEDRSVVTLSGGEKQRLAIASALAMAGKILVLDEPLSRLDSRGAAQVISVLRDIRKRYCITVIMAANNGNDIIEIADRVCILRNGRIIMCDTAETVLANHALLRENGVQPPGDVDVFSVFPVNNQNLPDKNPVTPAIEINGFSYSYGKDTCIENLNLSIADNDFIAITGRNGCGKTTLLKCITGLLRPVCGSIYVRGKNIHDLSVSGISREAGFVMQNPSAQLFTDSVYNEVSFALKNAGLSKQEIHERTEEALRLAGLENHEIFPHALNRDGRTRTVLASVLAMGCKIIILDEVDIGQDYNGSRHIMNIAKDLHSRGYTIIFVTHNIPLACEYAHRLIMMDKRILMDGKRQNIPYKE